MHISLDYQTTFIYKLGNFLMSGKIFREHNNLIVKYYILKYAETMPKIKVDKH
jgi:hypothetical protein